MKKYILFAAAMILVSTGFSQYVLSYKNNALIKGDVILSKEVQYVDPSSAGLNQIWDFSKITFNGTDNSSRILSSPTAKLEGVSDYNILLSEGGGREYYLNMTPTDLTEKGYTAKDLTMVYSDPVLKMIYPFTYGESFTDKYVGSALFQGLTKIDVSGDNTVTADAFGTLILPNLTLTNTLRVKAEKTGVEMNPCSSNVVDILKYSWYAPGYRYPVLVITTIESKATGQEPVITKSATINVQQPVNTETVGDVPEPQPQATNDIAVSVYPNPFNEKFNFNYFLRKQMPVKIALYDVIGKFTKLVLQSDMQAEGIHTGEIDAEELNLTPGMYYLRFTFENQVVVKKVVKL